MLSSHPNRTLPHAHQREIKVYIETQSYINNKLSKPYKSDLVEIEDISWQIVTYLNIESSKDEHVLTIEVSCDIQAPNSVYASFCLLNKNDSHISGIDSITRRFDAMRKRFVLWRYLTNLRALSDGKGTFQFGRNPYPDPMSIPKALDFQVIIRTEPSSTILQFLKREEDFADVEFEIDGQKLSLHRSVLASVSPVFKAMLFGGFKESADSNSSKESNLNEEKITPKTIPLPGKNLCLFLEMLNTIYPPQLEINSVRAKYLLPLFMEYQIMHSVAKCERALCESEIYFERKSLKDEATLDEAMDHLILCSKYDIPQLKQLAAGFVAGRKVEEFEKNKKFSQLSPDVKSFVYRSRAMMMDRPIK